MPRKAPPPGLVKAARKHRLYPPTVIERRGALVVCNKAAGLPSAGRNLDDPDCLQAHVMGLTRQKTWAVHQLDRDTSGINFFVLRSSLVQPCSESLSAGKKTYLTVVRGAWPHGAITIDAPIGRVDGSPQVMDSGRPARSEVRPLEVNEQASLLEVKIHTGRTHQVRLHLAHKGCPVIGDRRYGGGEEEAPRQILHAVRAECIGEVEGVWLAPVPDDFRSALSSVGLGDETLAEYEAPAEEE